jgi:hypothetical protein
MLRLNFRTGRGESPKLILTSFVRFCADGTLRGPDNYVVARCADTGWWVGGKLHRELDCEGPLRLRISNGASEPPLHLGPFSLVRTAGGEFYGDEACLHIPIPGQSPAAMVRGHELTMFSEGVKNGQTQLPTRQATERSGEKSPPAGKTSAQAGAHRGTGKISGRS